MKLLAPANPKELSDRICWFKKPVARKLRDKKGVEFGFELKEPTESIKSPPSLYWGYHLPGELSSLWYYHPEQRNYLLSTLVPVSELKPNYAVLHGIHLYWHPPARKYRQRYVNHSQSEEYLKVLEANIKLLEQLKKLFPVLLLENYPLYSYYQKNNQYLPETYLYTGSGRFLDLLYLKEKTGVGILFDLEHMIVLLNFLNREKNYRHLPRIHNPHPQTLNLEKIFGFVIAKGIIPYAKTKISLKDVIEKISPKYYHLTGSTRDVIDGKKILAHAPIKIEDKTFRKNLRLILAQKPEVLVLEVASSLDGPEWHYLRSNETELSFYALCEILLEEL